MGYLYQLMMFKKYFLKTPLALDLVLNNWLLATII